MASLDAPRLGSDKLPRIEDRANRGARWPANKVPGRTPEEIAAATTAAIIAPNAEAMRLELAKRR